MCGLVGYIGKGMSRDHVLRGLSRLEYRGYDSAGFACINPADKRLVYVKAPGQLSNLLHEFERSPIDGHLGIGHTRWSTHGVASLENAHPQFDCHKTLSVAHNGIIENYVELREELKAQGHSFHSQTDTEIIAHLLESLFAVHTDIKSALLALVNRLKGAYAIACISQKFPDSLLIIRKGSPLCVGFADDAVFVASDTQAFLGSANECAYLADKTCAIIDSNGIEAFDFEGNELTLEKHLLQATHVDWEKMGHEHFMLKEIYEQKNAIHQTLNFFRQHVDTIWDHVSIAPDDVRALEEIVIVAAGTSWHAGRIAQFYFETIAGIPTQVKLASEFRYAPFFTRAHRLYLFITQSGETADTLEAMRLVQMHGMPAIALTNVASSTIVREADGFLLTHAGQEIAVASTKAFSTQLVALFWFAHRVAVERGMEPTSALQQAEDDLMVAAEVLENSIENYKQLIEKDLAAQYALYKRYIFLGRHISYPFAMEAALKLKEISYIFAQCYPAGELKHGPIALIDEETPIFLFSTLDPLIYQKLLSNAQEVKARKGHLVVFAFEDQQELIDLADQVFIIPRVNPLLAPLAMAGLMQFFVYSIARVLECPIDRPRNLAKSVTVE